MKLPIIVIKKKSYPLRPFRSKKETDLQNIKTKVSKTIKKKSNNLYNNARFFCVQIKRRLHYLFLGLTFGFVTEAAAESKGKAFFFSFLFLKKNKNN